MYQQIKLSDYGIVIGHRQVWGIDAYKTNAQLLTCNEDIEAVTCAMSSTCDVLYKTLRF